MRLRIISDGTRKGTRVVNECGDVLDDVTHITWRFKEEEGEPSATIDIRGIGLEIIQVSDAELDKTVL